MSSCEATSIEVSYLIEACTRMQVPAGHKHYTALMQMLLHRISVSLS